MPRHGEFAVWMRCNEQTMEEHALRVDGNVVTAYIASEAGQQFELIWDVEDVDESARAELRMDGNFVRQRLHNHRRGRCEHTLNGVQVDQTSFRPFVFREVAFTDRDNDEFALEEDITPNDIENMGTITVEVSLVRLAQRRSKGFQFRPPPATLTRDVVLPERSKRVGSLRMGVSGAVVDRPLSNRPSSTRTVVSGTISDGPVAVFNFICRPREFLVAEGIIPKQKSEPLSPERVRSPTQRLFLRDIDSNTPGALPTPLATPSKFDVKKDIAIRELMEQRAQIRKRDAEIQSQLNKLTTQSFGTPIKLEGGYSRETALVVEDYNAEVIDLTAD